MVEPPANFILGFMITILLGLAGTLSLGNTPLGFASALLMVLGFGLEYSGFSIKAGIQKAELEKLRRAYLNLTMNSKRKETVKKALRTTCS